MREWWQSSRSNQLLRMYIPIIQYSSFGVFCLCVTYNNPIIFIHSFISQTFIYFGMEIWPHKTLILKTISMIGEWKATKAVCFILWAVFALSYLLSSTSQTFVPNTGSKSHGHFPIVDEHVREAEGKFWVLNELSSICLYIWMDKLPWKHPNPVSQNNEFSYDKLISLYTKSVMSNFGRQSEIRIFLRELLQ
jgi:hypothetical protein